ncbi:hypothetical protein ESA94_18725 [Lacibacter luteus]|uniref:Uncharacterized protein n=1 Tax=Lacibacter luteus TaxID=2508719 RepID=A0A4Q1CE51_9BACT|nr:hypothetical protein [Lacibacter luteus]RXK58049.1 hypothetical protein ESA94_18725 [Lacibacter luteus]
MKEVTGKLLSNLQKCDTAQILALYEVSASHIDQETYRTFIKENILNDCKWYNKITGKYGLPNLEKLSFTRDPQTQANVAILPLLPKEDTSLNLKSSSLYIEFYPDQFFNGRVLRFTVSKEILKIKETIKAPPIIQ